MTCGVFVHQLTFREKKMFQPKPITGFLKGGGDSPNLSWCSPTPPPLKNPINLWWLNRKAHSTAVQPQVCWRPSQALSCASLAGPLIGGFFRLSNKDIIRYYDLWPYFLNVTSTCCFQCHDLVIKRKRFPFVYMDIKSWTETWDELVTNVASVQLMW